jgi:hypothetical protein
MIDVRTCVYYFIVAVVRSSVNDKGPSFLHIARTGSCTGVSIRDVSATFHRFSSNDVTLVNVVTL